MTTKEKTGISLPALVALVISSAIGAGIFGLPSTLAQAATPGVALLAWGVTGFGIMMLALCLNHFVINKPHLTGISDYARDGFGDFAGFISGWGYWLSAWLGNVAFATMMMSAVGFFIPELKSGNSILAIFIASLISWSLTLLVIRGVESAAAINTVVTICKLIPLFAFVVIAVIVFKAGVFTEHFWQNFTVNTLGTTTYSEITLGGIISQMKGSIMSMMWVFVGIEGATVMAARAKKKSDAGKATIIGLIALLSIYVIISILPYGYMSQSELQNLHHPSLIYVFNDMVGQVGGAFMSIGLIISIFGAWLSWTMLPVEATTLMAEQGLLPKWFGKLNKNNAPANALILTQVLVQLFLVSLMFTESAYDFAYSLCVASVMVCYILVGAAQLKFGMEQKNGFAITIGFLALAFQIFAIVLAGLTYLWLCTIAYLVGFIFYYIAKKENTGRLNKTEILLMGIIAVLAIVAIVFLFNGQITI